MSQIPSHEEDARKARDKEAAYGWAEAAVIYESAITALLEKGEYLVAGETQERAAYCSYRAAYQSETKEEFKALLGATSEAYSRAADIYEMLEDPEKEARMLTNRAMENFYSSWLTEDPAERKSRVKECVKDYEIALNASKKTEDDSRVGKICNDFLMILLFYSDLISTQAEGYNVLESALELGSTALKALKHDDGYELARCYYLYSLHLSDKPSAVIESAERQQELLELGMSYAEKAVKLSVNEDDRYLIGVSHGVLSNYIYEVKGDPEAAKTLVKSHMENGEQIEDKLVLARAHENMSYFLDTIAYNEEEIDKIREAANEAIHHADKAVKYFKTVLNPIVTPFLARKQCRHHLAMVETDLEKKRHFELEGLDIALVDLEYAKKSGSVMGEMYLHMLLGGSYLSLAKLEKNEGEKSRLLYESLQYRKKFIEMSVQAQPFFHWNIAVAHATIVEINGQLAKSEVDSEKRIGFLLEAISNMEESIDYFNRHFKVGDDAVYRDNYAQCQIKFSEVLFQMYLASEDSEYLEKTVQGYNEAIETYKKLDKLSYVAWTIWKLAWAHYRLQEYGLTAVEFEGASRYYFRTGEKYPNHKEFYDDYGNYMEAWGNIARAMDYHSRDEYFLEKEYFEKAVHTLTSSNRWGYLSPNYQAWGKLAEAENQSRNDHCEKAISLFNDTSQLFHVAQKSIEEKLESIGEREETDMAAELIAASNLRVDYCRGRVALEEAKLLDRRGEHRSSSRKYGDAAQIFNKIVKGMETESERKGIRPLHSLCLAWQRKTQAEAKASPDLYIEASALFEEAREYSLNEKTRLLTRGHAIFCKALSAGIKYEVNREEQHHQELVRHLGSATDFYVRAGYDSALEYSRATQRIFEAYQYVDRARGASDPSEKARYLGAAERLLRVSAEAYQRAKHPEKRDEVVRLLRNLKEDREIAVSLSEILDTPGISSSTESFTMPTPSHEYPVGLDSFEHADIQVKMFLPDDTVTSGGEFSLELELYNPGKSPASLVHVERLVPDDFEVSSVSGMYRFVDEVLDLRGKRIGPLGTVEISLKARPHSIGEFTLEPRVVFVDDTGEQRSSDLESGIIKVREMGILSWLRGSPPSF